MSNDQGWHIAIQRLPVPLGRDSCGDVTAQVSTRIHNAPSNGCQLHIRFQDQLPSSAPRKLSLSSVQAPLPPRDAGLSSPRTRVGPPTFDGILNGGETWVSRRRASEGLLNKSGTGMARDSGGDYDGKGTQIREEEEGLHEPERPEDTQPPPSQPVPLPVENSALRDSAAFASSAGDNHDISRSSNNSVQPTGPPPGIPDLSSVDWSYLDPQGQLQGILRYIQR